ncbi:zinc finger protein 282-like isoform X2 [Ambystoma mexicanum]|uniref:zinc finger protein 282-like isoform X2 n=1 Tax=Ambystoma mexicanum TaxID=8296 RepID=UPI0037E80E0B
MNFHVSDKPTFHDVAAYFSEDEWKLLQEWQKDIYRNVMKEIQQALTSLGPLIASSIFSLRAKGMDEQCFIDHLNPEMRCTSNQPTRDTSAYSDVVLAINCEEHQYPTDPLDPERRSSNGSLQAGDAPTTKKGSLQIKEESENCSIDHQSSGRGQNRSVPTDPPSQVPRSVSRVEKYQDFEFPAGQHATVSASSLVHAESGEGRRKRRRYSGFSVVHTGKEKACHDTMSEIKVEILKSPEKGTNLSSSLWPGMNQELNEADTTLNESAFLYPRNSNFHKGISNTDTYHQIDCNLPNAKMSIGQLQAQNNIRPYACHECEKSFKTKQELTRHQRTHSGERPYHCTECKKSFSLRHHLIGHRRTHTGERPYQCAKCERRFSLKGNLNKHQKKHIEQLGGLSL